MQDGKPNSYHVATQVHCMILLDRYRCQQVATSHLFYHVHCYCKTTSWKTTRPLHPRAIWKRLGRFVGFSKQPKQARVQGERCPCPHVSRQKARRGDGFGPTSRGASLPGRQHPTSTTPGLRARPSLHKGRDSAWPSPPRALRPAPSPGLRPRPGGEEEGKGAASPGRSARCSRGAPRAPHLPVAPATCPSRPQPDHRRPTLTAPAPPQPAKALASSRLLRPAAARASGGRALSARDQSRRTAAAHWGSRERAEEAANRRREARAAQLRGAMADAWAGPGASLVELTTVARAGLGARRVAAAGSAGREVRGGCREPGSAGVRGTVGAFL